MTVPHLSCPGINNGSPAVDFGFIVPLAGFAPCKVEWSAIDRAEWVGWWVIHVKLNLVCVFAKVRFELFPWTPKVVKEREGGDEFPAIFAFSHSCDKTGKMFF